ncbi:energy transducer TonB [Thiobacillus sp.]|uniref:energy transducer TonB n=1 Tax=Thiobacillus sp. TaxID=924 RepID=UPI0025CEE373|nr:energy transducer TonB [Thiobacillus sp.]
MLGLLLFAADTPQPIAPPRPLTISLITPEAAKPQPAPQPKPRPQPRPAPKPQLPEPVVKPLPPPILAAKPTPTPAPQPAFEEVPVPAPVAKPAPVPEPVSAPETVPVPVAAEASKPAPAPPTPPRQADYLANPKPHYPPLSRRLGEAGTVRLNILVNPDGSVARLELAQSSGYPRLDRSAMETVQSSWKFEPARQGGKPVAAWVIVPIQFTLRS